MMVLAFFIFAVFEPSVEVGGLEELLLGNP